ncbi:MAG: DHA2 family efflux MFS transporter permease subunit [Rhodospirillaceae bacterium]|jgi:MFS transporter, DHA2 family, multidrug resistance protein|nr:DHA2 family efflux MFS transporter permease subunit [Rhodospirillaceae bacterium]MBT6117268.1 DHA2 family efflux MFS transporter permease subunit [Rhodospirillaceae bacterium]
MNDVGQRDGRPLSGARLWLTILAVMLPTTVYVLDLTIVTVALPHMQGSFSATADQIAWVLTGYLVGQSIVTACSGWLSQRFGRKQIYLLATVGFTIISVFCGMAGSLQEEVFWRVLQGMFGAPLLPLSQAIMLDIFPREKHGTANSIWGMGILIGPVLGPTVGGVLTEAYSWPWVFYVNVPVLIPALLGVWLLVPRTARNPEHRLDWFGFSALILAVGAFQLALNRGQREDWFASTEIVVEAGIAALFLYVFLVHSFTSRNPFLRPGIFANRNYSLAVVYVFFFAILIQSPIVLLSLYFQTLGGYPVEEVGWLLTPRGVSAFASMMLGGPLLARFDPRIIMLVGLACFGTSTLFMSQWTPDVDAWTVAWTGLIQGAGSGFVWVPLGTLAYATLARRDLDDGIAMVHLTFTLGASIGIVAVINVMLTGTITSHAVLTEFVTPFTQTLAGDAARGAWNLEARKGLALVDHVINRQAGVIGYSNAFLALTVIAYSLIPFVWLFVKTRESGHTDTAGPA